jgi:U3 small nucleolar RNA-associated protein 20
VLAAHRRELVPVLTRILYAKIVQRKVQGARNSLAQRRAAVLAFMAGLREEEFCELVGLVFRPFRRLSEAGEEEAQDRRVLEALNSKKLLGFLNTLKDLVDQVGQLLVQHLPRICDTLLTMIAYVFSSGAACDPEAEEGDVQECAEVEDGAGEGKDERTDKVLKKLRGLCLRRVTDIVTKYKTYDFSRFIPRLFATLMPRVLRLPVENTQSPVGLLMTFHEMAHNDELAAHLFTNPKVLPAIFACMSAPKAAYTVRKAVLEIAEVLVAKAEALGLAKKLAAHMSVLLDHVYLHLKVVVDKGGPTKVGDLQAQAREMGLMRLQFDLLSVLSKFECTPVQAQQLLDLLIPFLANRTRFGNVSASDQAKTFILETCANLVKLIEDTRPYVAPAARQLLPALSAQARAAACSFIAGIGAPLEAVAGYVLDLNAMSTTRLDEYDFDRRLAAYNACSRATFLVRATDAHLRVLAAQCMHDVRDEDVSIRNHSIKLLGLILERIQRDAGGAGGAATRAGGGGHLGMQMAGTAEGKGAEMWEVYIDVVYPALRKNLGDKKRQVRQEAWRLLMQAAALFTDFHGDLADLRHVDPEQNISLNLLHIQMHRRVRALMALHKVVARGAIGAASLRHLLMPLIWWYMIEPQDKDKSAGRKGQGGQQVDDGAYNLSDEAIRTAGAIALQLPWKDYQVPAPHAPPRTLNAKPRTPDPTP